MPSDFHASGQIGIRFHQPSQFPWNKGSHFPYFSPPKLGFLVVFLIAIQFDQALPVCVSSTQRCLEHFCRGNEFTPKALEDFGAEEIRIRLAGFPKMSTHGGPMDLKNWGCRIFQTPKKQKKPWNQKEEKSEIQKLLLLFWRVFCCLFFRIWSH